MRTEVRQLNFLIIHSSNENLPIFLYSVTQRVYVRAALGPIFPQIPNYQ